MKQISTMFLRAAIVFIGVATLAVCVLLLPQGITSDEVGGYRAILLGLYIPAIPFFIALYQTLKLLRYIDKNTAFSNASVTALKNIKYCATVVSSLFTVGLPYIYQVADQDDAPGVLALALVIVFASVVIAVFAAVLEKLFHSAIAIKTENDLTV